MGHKCFSIWGDWLEGHMMANHPHIWGDWLSCDPVRGTHDSRSPHIRRELLIPYKG